MENINEILLRLKMFINEGDKQEVNKILHYILENLASFDKEELKQIIKTLKLIEVRGEEECLTKNK